MSNQPIKIARIINESTFVINKGENSNITLGDVFIIRGKDAISIEDPDSGRSLGSFSPSKGEIFVTEVHEEFSICNTEDYEEEVPTIGSAMLSSTIDLYKTKRIKRYKKLNVNPVQITGGADTTPIEVGDIVEPK